MEIEQSKQQQHQQIKSLEFLLYSFLGHIVSWLAFCLELSLVKFCFEPVLIPVKYTPNIHFVDAQTVRKQGTHEPSNHSSGNPYKHIRICHGINGHIQLSKQHRISTRVKIWYVEANEISKTLSNQKI